MIPTRYILKFAAKGICNEIAKCVESDICKNEVQICYWNSDVLWSYADSFLLCGS